MVGYIERAFLYHYSNILSNKKEISFSIINKFKKIAIVKLYINTLLIAVFINFKYEQNAINNNITNIDINIINTISIIILI